MSEKVLERCAFLRPFQLYWTGSVGGFRLSAAEGWEVKIRHGEVGLFEVGDKVVYPHHGAGTVVKRETREVLGEKREYLTIQILHNDMTVNVPCENADKVGLRKVIDEEMVELVTSALTGDGTVMPKNWNRRFKHNRDKMKTGDIFELAEVVRNLSLRDKDKGLSTGEKQMFVKAKKILASELMYAMEMEEDEAAVWLDDVLASAVGTAATASV
jgi:CarD family transcriptional regulator